MNNDEIEFFSNDDETTFNIKEENVKTLNNNVDNNISLDLKKRKPLLELINMELIFSNQKRNFSKKNRKGLSSAKPYTGLLTNFLVMFFLGIFYSIQYSLQIFNGTIEMFQEIFINGFVVNLLISCAIGVVYSFLEFGNSNENEIITTMPVKDGTRFLAKFIVSYSNSLICYVGIMLPYCLICSIIKPQFVIIDTLFLSLLNGFLVISYSCLVSIVMINLFSLVIKKKWIVYLLSILSFVAFTLPYLMTSMAINNISDAHPLLLTGIVYAKGIEHFYPTLLLLSFILLFSLFTYLIVRFLYFKNYNEKSIIKSSKKLSKEKILAKIKHKSQTSELFLLELRSRKAGTALVFEIVQIVCFVVIALPMFCLGIYLKVFYPSSVLDSTGIYLLYLCFFVGMIVPFSSYIPVLQANISKDGLNFPILRTLNIKLSTYIKLKTIYPTILNGFYGAFFSCAIGLMINLDVANIILNAILVIVGINTFVVIATYIDGSKPRFHLNNDIALYQGNTRILYCFLMILAMLVGGLIIFSIEYAIIFSLPLNSFNVAFIICQTINILIMLIFDIFMYTNGVQSLVRKLESIDL